MTTPKPLSYMTDEQIKELAEEALHAACRTIQDHIDNGAGQLDGGWASMFFSGKNEDMVHGIFESYIRSELGFQNTALPTIEDRMPITDSSISELPGPQDSPAPIRGYSDLNDTEQALVDDVANDGSFMVAQLLMRTSELAETPQLHIGIDAQAALGDMIHSWVIQVLNNHPFPKING